MGLYMYIFGYFKQFNILRFSYLRILLSFFEIILASTLRYKENINFAKLLYHFYIYHSFSIVCENLAVISMWGGDWYDFYIVEKENDPSPDTEDSETQKLVEVV